MLVNIKKYMGQTYGCYSDKPTDIETEELLKGKPPDPRPPQNLSAGAKFAELKLQEHRAGGHALMMVSCIH